MDKHFDVATGSAALDQQLEFRAFSVVVDNPTNQWVSLDALGIVIPQYTLGATYPMPGTTRARLSFTAPAGQVEPPTIANQVVSVTFYDIALPLTAGVGMLGGRAPYYDRNPLQVTKGYTAAGIAPHAGTSRWTYTVPALRKAYVQTAMARLMRDAVAAPAADAYCYVGYTAVGGSEIFITLAEELQNTVGLQNPPAAFAGVGLMSAGDVVRAITADTSTGGSYTYRTSLWAVEFDS